MEVLSRTLRKEERTGRKGGAFGVDLPIDYGNTWQYNASEEDEKRRQRKVWHKEQALAMAAKVNRNHINEMLLKEQDVFEDTPKYRTITKRLYRPYEYK